MSGPASSTAAVVVSTVVTLLAAMAGWAYTLAATFAQSPGINGDTALTAFASTALTATAGAFLWLVRLIASGTLVHRDPAQALSRITSALDRNSAAIEAATRREEILTELLLERAADRSR